MNIKEKIESNPLFWALTIALAAFTAGLGCYKAVLEIAKLETVASTRLATLNENVTTLESQAQTLTQERDALQATKVTLELQLAAIPPPKKPEQDWLHFTEIDFPRHLQVQRYRVIFEADGVVYSYPGSAVWKEFGSKPSTQKFPLPVGRQNHMVKCEVICEAGVSEDTQIIRLIGVEPIFVAATSSPHAEPRTYNVLPVVAGIRGVTVPALASRGAAIVGGSHEKVAMSRGGYISGAPEDVATAVIFRIERQTTE